MEAHMPAMGGSTEGIQQLDWCSAFSAGLGYAKLGPKGDS